jgi:hypothetical protein
MKKRWGFLHEELVLSAVESALLPTGAGGILEEFGPVTARKEATAAADIAKEAVKVFAAWPQLSVLFVLNCKPFVPDDT